MSDHTDSPHWSRTRGKKNKKKMIWIRCGLDSSWKNWISWVFLMFTLHKIRSSWIQIQKPEKSFEKWCILSISQHVGHIQQLHSLLTLVSIPASVQNSCTLDYNEDKVEIQWEHIFRCTVHSGAVPLPRSALRLHFVMPGVTVVWEAGGKDRKDQEIRCEKSWEEVPSVPSAFYIR